MKFRTLALAAVGALFLSFPSLAQTGSLEGTVKGEDGKPLANALIKIERKDIKGNYKVKTKKKGDFFHAGLPLGMYRVILEVDGRDRDFVDNIRVTLGDPTPVNFDMQAQKQRAEALQKAAESGTLTKEQAREMSAEQREAIEKQMKERAEAMRKNKALNDAFTEGTAAMQAKNFEGAVAGFQKAAAEVDPNTPDASQKKNVGVVYAQLAEAYIGLANTKTGAEQEAALGKGFEAYKTAIAAVDAAEYHNNYALALVKAKKIPEAQAELTKAAQLDPPKAGQYYYNLGAVLTNSGQGDAASQAFQQAIQADPNYAEAYYQYGVSLMAKAQVGADGKVTPAPGTKEALEKYLALKPDGANAESAKGMLAMMDTKLDTTYKNPAAPDPAAAKKGKKK
jgi:tetratricopeptide (TPR) repeat protein